MTSFENIQIKISPRERIFEHKRTPSSVNDLNSLPKCFYHNEDDILFFCKHPRCTLPLCQKCLNMHRVEHLNRKEIPMQNVISFKECRQFVLSQLKQNKAKVKSVMIDLKQNHKVFETKMMQYKQQLFEMIELTLNKLRDELFMLDEQNSVLKVKEISQSIEKVTNENSLNDIIKCWENYYQKRDELNSQSDKINQQKDKETKNSIIDHVKFVVDQKDLSKVVERGFLNCKFVRHQLKQQTPKAIQSTKLDRQQYLLHENDSPPKQLSLKTPINKLESLNDTSQKKPAQLEHVNWQQNAATNEFPSTDQQIDKIVEVKRQQRRSIFKQSFEKQKQNNPSVAKSLSFNNFHLNNKDKIFKKEHLFSDVKKYNIEGENEEKQREKNINIYTQNLNFQSFTNPVQTPIVSRARSSSSLKSKGKGISLVKPRPLQQIDHYRQKSKESVNKMKIKLKSQSNHRNTEEVSFARDSSYDWKRVVNLTDSSASSFRQSRVTNHRQNVYGTSNESFSKTQGQQGFQYFKGIQNADVLNPMQMRQLLMKKRNNLKPAVNGSLI